jgi:hypothetical protein
MPERGAQVTHVKSVQLARQLMLQRERQGAAVGRRRGFLSRTGAT